METSARLSHSTPIRTCKYPVPPQVVQSRSTSQIRNKSSRSSLAIKYKKQLHWRSASASSIHLHHHQQHPSAAESNASVPIRLASLCPGVKPCHPKSCAAAHGGVSDICPPARERKGGILVGEAVSLPWIGLPVFQSACLPACLPETFVLRDTSPSAKAGNRFFYACAPSPHRHISA